jgi:DNA polymerase-4
MAKVIFHLDLDCFFVSAERLRRPELRGRKVAIGHDGPRGVVASCSYEARKFGVRSAMPIAQAKRACPGLVIVPGDHAFYAELSRKVFALVTEFTPVFEATGIDEGYLDMTGTSALFGPPREAAEKVRARILGGTGLTCSIGIASNRLVAKVATDSCKPNGLREVPAGEEAAFLAPFPVRSLPGCGPVAERELHARGVFTVGDLQRRPEAALHLADAARGEGSTEFHEEARTRSSSREMTFERDLGDEDELKRRLWEISAELGRALRADGDYARGVRLKLRYPPFETVLRSRVLSEPTQLDEALYAAIVGLFDEHWERGRPLRLLGAGCVLGDGRRQLGLFEDHEGARRRERLARLKDELRDRFGEKVIVTGRDLPGKLGE